MAIPPFLKKNPAKFQEIFPNVKLLPSENIGELYCKASSCHLSAVEHVLKPCPTVTPCELAPPPGRPLGLHPGAVIYVDSAVLGPRYASFGYKQWYVITTVCSKGSIECQI